MAIFINRKKIKDLYFGNVNLLKEYKGNQLIYQKKDDGVFPTSFGKLNKITTTKTFCKDKMYYAWSLHFDNGVLPVVLEYDSMTAKICLEMFEKKGESYYYDRYTQQDELVPEEWFEMYNSVIWNTVQSQNLNRWVNSYARGRINYNRCGNMIDSIGYTAAQNLTPPWTPFRLDTNEVYDDDTTNIFSFSIGQNSLSATKNGKAMIIEFVELDDGLYSGDFLFDSGEQDEEEIG